MLKTHQSRAILLLWAGAFFLSVLTPLPLHAAQPDDPVLSLIPAETLLCLRINNLDGTLMETDRFLTGVSPVGLSMIAKMGLGGLLGNPMLAGVNTGGSFAVFVTAGPAPGAMPVVAGLVPVSDFGQFVGTSASGAEPDGDGLTKLSGQGTPALLTCSLDKYALIGLADNRAGFLALKQKISAKSASLAGLVDAAQAQQAQDMPLWMFCNIPEINKAFGPLLQMKLQQFKAMMQQATTQAQMPAGADPAKIMDMYVAVLDTLLKETASVTVSLKPSPDAILLSKSVKAKPGTGLAKMLPAVSGEGFDQTLLGYLPDDSAVNVAMCMSVPAWLEMNAKMLDWLTVGLGESISEQATEKMRAMMVDATAALGQSGVFSLVIDQAAKPPLQMRYVLEVKDAEKLKALIDQGAEMFNSVWGDFYKSMGMEVAFDIKRGVAEHRGVSIDSALLSMQMSDKNAPEAAMINNMYGDGFQYRWATTEKLLVSAIGSQPDVQVRQMIDMAMASGEPVMPKEMKAAMSLLPQAKQANLVMTLNVLRFWGMIKAMAPVPLPDIAAKTTSNIVIATSSGAGRFTVDLAVPKAHVIEIRDVVQGMIAQNMQKESSQ